MKIAPTRSIFWESSQGNIGEQLNKAGRSMHEAGEKVPNLLVVVLPEGGNDIYTAVKQCVLFPLE